jgi:hypothetical protein
MTQEIKFTDCSNLEAVLKAAQWEKIHGQILYLVRIEGTWPNATYVFLPQGESMKPKEK